MNWRYKNLVGKKYNRWVVLSTKYEKNKNGYCLWLCRCECGIEKEIPSCNLTQGSSMSCGCLTREKARLQGLSRAGKTGYKHTDKSKKQISLALHLRKRKKESFEKISASKIGKHYPKMSIALLGKSKPSIQGEKHYKWIEDRTIVLEKHRIRGSIEWKQWRESVFVRDKFTCKECGIIGGYLEPHHIVPIRSDMNKLFNTK